MLLFSICSSISIGALVSVSVCVCISAGILVGNAFVMLLASDYLRNVHCMLAIYPFFRFCLQLERVELSNKLSRCQGVANVLQITAIYVYVG